MEDGMSGYIETDMVTPIRGKYEGRCSSENMEDGMSGYIETDMVTPIRGKYEGRCRREQGRWNEWIHRD